MMQDEKWIAKYNEIMAFMAENHRRPSKYYLEERNNWNWMRHQQKLMGKGEIKEERVVLFERLMELCGYIGGGRHSQSASPHRDCTRCDMTVPGSSCIL